MAVTRLDQASRRAALECMASEPVDLLIIGGGITGAGLAREAALQGLRVALVEKEDFGAGTSGRSSKLVHGGVRYLAQGEFRLVREAALERRVLQTIAPHLVQPLPFIYPIYRDDSLLKYRMGFLLFDLLAGASPGERHQMLTPAQVRERAPGLREPLRAGILFDEFLTDDARLTLENARSAAEHGALVANHAAVTALLEEDGRVKGAIVRDQLGDSTYGVRARLVVNAAGPWASAVMGLSSSQCKRRLRPSKGVHLLFRADRLPLDGAVALKSPSGKEGFAIRRQGFVYVGTTDAPHEGALEHPAADADAVAELLALTQSCFPQLELTERDILGTWAGLRPLIEEPGKSTRDTSRHDEIWAGPPGLMTVAGGKLTTYRAMAGRIMGAVNEALGVTVTGPRRSAEAPLPSAIYGGRPYAEFRAAALAALQARGLGEQAAERLLWLYGGGVDGLLAMEPEWLEPLAPGADAVRGEVRLAVEHEMALTLVDLLDRRMGLLLFSQDQGRSLVEPAATIMGDLLGWSEAERQRQVAEYRQVANLHGVSTL